MRISPYQTEAGSSVGVECKHTEWETFWETKFLTQQSVRHVAVLRPYSWLPHAKALRRILCLIKLEKSALLPLTNKLHSMLNKKCRKVSQSL